MHDEKKKQEKKEERKEGRRMLMTDVVFLQPNPNCETLRFLRMKTVKWRCNFARMHFEDVEESDLVEVVETLKSNYNNEYNILNREATSFFE